MNYRKLLVLLTAFLYAYLLITLIPIDAIKDRGSYLDYASWPEVLIIKRLEGGVLALIFNEPIFLLINFVLSFLFDEENVVRTIIFFGSFTTSYLVLRYNYRYFLLLLFFLLIPQVLKNYVIHLRQGLAMSFFLIGYLSTSKNKFKNSFFILLSPLIHSSFFVLVFLIYLNKFLEKFRLDVTLKILVIALFGIISSFIMETVGQLSGARQAAQYEFTSADISGLAFLFWVVVFIIYTLQGKHFLKNNLLSIAILIFYLTTYFFIPVTARIFESGIVLVLLSSLSLSDWRKYSFIGLILFYTAYTVFSQIGSPYFGWGVS
jgi:hypothetical protein